MEKRDWADGQTIAERIVDKVDDDLKPQVIHWAAHYVSCTVQGADLKLTCRN